MMEVINILLEFLRTDIFISFGLLTIPFLIGRSIPKIRHTILNVDEVACRVIVFSGIAYTIIILLSYTYIFLVIGDQNSEYAIINRSKGPYAWAYWGMVFSWLCITQPFRFKWVRKNVFIRLISIPFFLLTLEQYTIFITSMHRDYLATAPLNFDLSSVYNTIPDWFLFFIFKLILFIGYVLLFQWISEKLKKNKVVS